MNLCIIFFNLKLMHYVLFHCMRSLENWTRKILNKNPSTRREEKLFAENFLLLMKIVLSSLPSHICGLVCRWNEFDEIFCAPPKPSKIWYHKKKKKRLKTKVLKIDLLYNNSSKRYLREAPSERVTKQLYWLKHYVCFSTRNFIILSSYSSTFIPSYALSKMYNRNNTKI